MADGLCPAGATGQPFAEHPGDRDADRGAVFRFDEPGLPLGPRHELRSRDWPQGGENHG